MLTFLKLVVPSKIILPVPTLTITFAPVEIVEKVSLPSSICSVAFSLKPIIVSKPSPF